MKYKVVTNTILSFMLISIFVIFIFINYFNYEKSMEFKDNVVFYVQHQDDETLWASSAIERAIAEKGKNNVYIVQVSYGINSNEFKKDKKFKNMTMMEKYEYREREFLAATKQLGIKEENIIIIPRMIDKYEDSFKLEEKIALDFEKKLKSVTHIAHTYKYDNHSEHIKNGKVIYYLYKQGKIKDVKFFVKPKYEFNIPITEIMIYKTIDDKSKENIRRACEEYKLIDEEQKREGIGYKSDNLSFDKLLREYKSILHTGNV